MVTINQKAEGYRGVWYMNQPSGDQYVYKYSGGLGTYCAKHQPFAIYSAEARKTFFCYGGSREDDNQSLLHMVSYYDHDTGRVPRPTILLDKQTDDAHDNPVISMDSHGYIWIFSTSHGTERPSYIHRSLRPHDIDEFGLVPATRLENGRHRPFDNFSYMQVWHTRKYGFCAFLTHYHDPAIRTSFFVSSRDGVRWSEWRRLAAIEEGHYQISASNGDKVVCAFNYHPAGQGLNWRSNLYYMESTDGGATWVSAQGDALQCPLTTVENEAMVWNYRRDGLNVYLKDLQLDSSGNPVILYLTSKGYESGPRNNPRTWMTARWNGMEWDIQSAMTSDNNYDTGSIYIENEGQWRIVAPTEVGPQPYNPGGEVVSWYTENHGKKWHMVRKLTTESPRNHTYVRRPVDAEHAFYSLWADGHARQPSTSELHFADSSGNVFDLPVKMTDNYFQCVDKPGPL